MAICTGLCLITLKNLHRTLELSSGFVPKKFVLYLGEKIKLLFVFIETIFNVFLPELSYKGLHCFVYSVEDISLKLFQSQSTAKVEQTTGGCSAKMRPRQ